MKTITLVLLVILGISTAHAELKITSDKKYVPSADWTNNKDFTEQAWWSAFYSLVRPDTFTFSEWKKHYPEKLLTTGNITESRFPSIIAEEIKKQKDYPPETKISRVVSISDGSQDYVVVIACIVKSPDPKDEFYATQFFKKIDSEWVVGEFSADLKNDPIANLIQTIQ